MNNNNVLSNFQYGFRPNSSSVDAVSQLVADVILGFEKNQFTVAILLDISKAFDTIEHKILLKTLSFYGICEKVYNWLETYLSNRSQYVDYYNNSSSISKIDQGVPQGSILGPLLFSLYTNDLPYCVSNSNIIQFADDTPVYISGTNIQTMCQLMNSNLKALFDWFSCNKLSLNTNKTTAICFKKQSQTLPHSSFKLHINGCIIQVKSTVTLLGLHLDELLRWDIHASYLSKHISKILYMLNRLKNILPSTTLKMIYNGLIHSKLSYGIILWGSSYKCIQNDLFKLQKKSFENDI